MTPWYNRAKTLLRERNLYQQDVAAALDVKPATVSHYLNGNREPSIGQIQQIARLLGVSMSELVEEDVRYAATDFQRDILDAADKIPNEERRQIALRMIQSLHDSDDSEEPED